MRSAAFARTAIAALFAISFALPVAYAVEPDNTFLFVPSSAAVGGSNSLGAFAINPITGDIWTGVFTPNHTLRRISYDAETGTYDDGDVYATPTDLADYGRAINDYQSRPDWSYGEPRFSGMALNPTAITIDGHTYEAGSLLYVLSSATVLRESQTPRIDRPEYTKYFFIYDLRKIGSPTTATPGYPDRGDAAYYDVLTSQYVTIGAEGVADWNDVFHTLATAQDFYDVVGEPYTANIGRQFAFSSDGQSVYFTDTNADVLWKMNAATGALTAAFQTGGSNTEPAVVHSSIRNFGAGTGDQILLEGKNFNVGGINFVVDNGSGVFTEHVLLEGDRLREFIGLNPDATISVRSIASDAEGNIYFYENSTQSIFMLDTEGRLIAVRNQAQAYEFNKQHGSTSTSGSSLRLQAIAGEHETAGSITQLLFQSVAAKSIGGVYVFKPMDLDRDGQVTLADVLFFQTQYDRTTVPVIADGQAYLDYIKADLTGDSELNGTSNATGLKAPSVTFADVKALWQFVQPGDADVNGKVDALDLLAASPAFNQAAPNQPGGFSWEEGDWNFDGVVNAIDLLEASPHFNKDEPTALVTLLAVDEGEPHVIYDPATGEVRINPGNKVGINSFVFISASGVFTGDPMIPPGTSMFLTDTDTMVALNFFAPALMGETSLGAIMATGLTEAFLLNDLTLLGGISGQNNFEFALVVIPEPTTVMLMSMTGVTVLLRRRRQG